LRKEYKFAEPFLCMRIWSPFNRDKSRYLWSTIGRICRVLYFYKCANASAAASRFGYNV